MISGWRRDRLADAVAAITDVERECLKIAGSVDKCPMNVIQ
jgi:hypothetical protein